MLKYIVLGAAIAMTAPALAQTAAVPSDPVQGAPATAGRTPMVDPAAPVTASVDPSAPAAPADPAATAAAQPAPADQVAQVVDAQFATYDKDGDGKLDEAEFGGWMVALKSQTDPRTDAASPATKKWNQAAFAQADIDKNRSVSKAELTGFLTPAKS